MSIADAFRKIEEKQQTEHKADFFCRYKPIEEEKEAIFRVGTPIRMSSLPYFCGREMVLLALASTVCDIVVQKKVRTLAETIKMARGTAMHRAFQNEILPSMGAIDGYWECSTCAGYQSDLGPRPVECPVCMGKDLRYVEMTLRHDGLMLTGHMDGLWLAEKSILEIKTCDIGTYSKVVSMGPLHAHKIQTGAYLDAWNSNPCHCGDWIMESVRFLYVPMTDVDAVKIPSPKDRKVPFELDIDTGMITFKLPKEVVLDAWAPVARDVSQCRKALQLIASGYSYELSPMPRHQSCKSLDNAGRWKYGCSCPELCFAADNPLDRSGTA